MADELGKAARRARIATPRLLRGNPDGGDNGGMLPDIEARVKALEARTSEIGVDVRAMIKDVAEIKGKISQMPTTFQMQAWFVGVSLGLVALVFAVARALK
ncbi:MAG: hypothetical protein GEV13_32175 [Rhodospirillales bacterium]|nr:hypothetical protein [Rhodospirillales bacterium]